MRSGDPLKRGFRVDYTGEVVLMDSLDAPCREGEGGDRYDSDKHQFIKWLEDSRNEHPKPVTHTDSAVCDVAQVAALMCVGRNIPQAYKWKIEIANDVACVAVSTPHAGEIRFKDASLGLLLFQLETVKWDSLRPPEPPPPEPQFTPQQRARQDAFERIRAEILARRSAS